LARLVRIQTTWLVQVSAMIETKSSLRRSWYDYNWDWVLISLLALVLLAGIVVLWTYTDHPPKLPPYSTTLRQESTSDPAS